MADTLALVKLYDDVVARFIIEGPWIDDPPTIPVPNLFGWRKPAQYLVTSPRIIWVPGDDASGEIGAAVSAKHPGRNPRALHTIPELATIYLHAVDLDDLEDEKAQYIEARFLYDAWLRAVNLAALGTYSILSNRWVISKKERRYGAAIRVLLSIEAMIPDLEHDTAPQDTTAQIAVGLDSNNDAVFTEETLDTETP